MSIIRPRLVDHFGIPVTQEDIDFAIPFLDEDIPLYLDPFLLWKSPSQQDYALHGTLVNSFNYLGVLANSGNESKAKAMIVDLSECQEAGLGLGKSKKGLKMSGKVAENVLCLFQQIPQIKHSGFTHLEEVQLLVNGLSKDRISDISCNLLKSFLIDFTQDECKKYNIPMMNFEKIPVYRSNNNDFVLEKIDLPYNPIDESPIIFVPKRWLRFMPWISFEDYFKNSFVKQGEEGKIEKPSVLAYNRHNYDMVQAYVSMKERTKADCKNDPLFKQIPIISAKKTISTILDLPTGKDNNADKKYENACAKMFASLLYPHLDFAQEQSRVDGGTHIRDLIFYNNCSNSFLSEVYKDYESKQIVFEMKNVVEVSNEHVNQLNRYLAGHLGRFGVLVVRNKLKGSVYKNIINLWAGQRKCIITLTDEDLKLMVGVYESKQRDPIEVLKMKYVEFMRDCPT